MLMFTSGMSSVLKLSERCTVTQHDRIHNFSDKASLVNKSRPLWNMNSLIWSRTLAIHETILKHE